MLTNRLYFAVAVGAALAIGCAERPSPAGPTLEFQAVAPTAAPAPFVTGLINPCNGEFVDIEGWTQVRLDTPLLFAAVVVLSLLGVLLFNAIAMLERIALPWNRLATEVAE